MSGLVVCENLSVGYGGRTVVRDVSFSLGPGECMLVLGHNGAGKSTLLKTLFGLLPPVGGEFSVFDSRNGRASSADLFRSGCRYLGQGMRSFADLTVEENRRVLTTLYGYPPADPQSLGLPLEPRPVRIGQLSVGRRRLEALTLLAAGSPRLMMLDEPMAGLDRGARARVADWIAASVRDKNLAVLIVEHEFDDLITVANRALVVKSGLVTFLGSASTIRDSRVLSDVYF
jgi:branched-chain amino acid transport system ATP-binding protein